MTPPVLTVLLLVVAASSARGEEFKTPPLQLGAAVSGIAPIAAEGPYLVFGAGPRLTLNVGRWLGLEFGLERVGPSESTGITALYTSQLKIPLRRSSTRTLSVTAGAAGLLWYKQRSEVRITRPDQSIVVHPSSSRVFLDPPSLPMVGVTQDVVVHQRVAVSWSAQAMVGEATGFAIRGSLGVSFGMGGYR